MHADASFDGRDAGGFRGGHPTGAVRAGDWTSRPAGVLGVKSIHGACEAGSMRPCFAGSFSSSLRAVRGEACKGSISHLEKPKVRILDYPMMGESVGASLRRMGDA